MKLNKTEKAENRKAELLAVGEACKAIIRPALDFQERTFDSSGFSEEGTLVSVSVVPDFARDVKAKS